MKAALLDVNVLLALAWPTHQHHQAAHKWFHRDARKGWATCALTQLGFVRLSSNPAYTADAVSPQSAAALLSRLTAHVHHLYWSDLPALDVDTLRHAAGHQQVMDAYLVGLARVRKGHVVSFDTRLAAHAATAGEATIIGE